MSDADADSDTQYNSKDDTAEPLVDSTRIRRPQRRSRRTNRFKRKRKLLNYLLTISIALIALAIICSLVYAFKSFDKDRDYRSSAKPSRHPKRIFLWNEDPEWRLPSSSVGPPFLREEFRCEVSNCEIQTYPSISTLQSYDAIVFGAANKHSKLVPDRNYTNKPQFFVYASNRVLSSEQDYLLQQMHKFNLTMSFHTNSDIVWQSSEVRQVSGERVAPAIFPKWKDYQEFKTINIDQMILQYKTKFAMINICNNTTIGASVYEELRKYLDPPSFITVDSGCISPSLRDKMPTNSYKFMFTFEDALCVDEISEFFYRALQNHVVPVVLGGPTEYTNFAPPHSFIRADTFDSIRELAEYLIFLDGNSNEYAEYLWWTNFYVVRPATSPFCELCALLHDIRFSEFDVKKTVNSEWWNSNRCLLNTSLLSS